MGDFNAALQKTLSDPAFAYATGLLTGTTPGQSFGQSAQRGLMNAQSVSGQNARLEDVRMRTEIAQQEQQRRNYMAMQPPAPSVMQEKINLMQSNPALAQQYQEMFGSKPLIQQTIGGGAVPPPVPMTTEQKAQFGLGPDQGAYVTSKGEIKTITPASKEGAVLKARTENAVQDYHTGVDMIYNDDGSVDRQMLATTRIPGTEGNTYFQAVSRGVETLLRIATGAAAPDAEVAKYADMYAPSVLDSDAAIKNKIESFDRFMSLIQKHSGMGEMSASQIEDVAKESGLSGSSSSGALNWSDM